MGLSREASIAELDNALRLPENRMKLDELLNNPEAKERYRQNMLQIEHSLDCLKSTSGTFPNC